MDFTAHLAYNYSRGNPMSSVLRLRRALYNSGITTSIKLIGSFELVGVG